ncbi:MAG: hypothetical protein MPJ24_08840, partial [Pirellulaceae bacterium]|nr:hypothetical protein [Pirellulaceae bacterium]
SYDDLNEPTRQISVLGKVVSDIQISGGGGRFDDDYNTLSLLGVSASKGAKVKLIFLVRGEYRDQIQFEATTIDPKEALSVAIEDRKRSGDIDMYSLVIEVPPGAPYVKRLGNSQSEAGRIVFKTNHPYAKEIEIKVHLQVLPGE